ncbi:hypothetical protein AB0F91_24655 [Amycolatopsis sp. NPDC023774]|uniref:hypothetical protein n=1 Tax=Amycolatopsis sp. NPDC023774 TaxID=3155015 RepID=UPI0033F07854
MLFTQCAAVTTVLRFALSTTVAVQLESSPWSVKKSRPTVLDTALLVVHGAPSGPPVGGLSDEG